MGDDLYDDAEEGQEDTEDTAPDAAPPKYGDKTAAEMGLSGVPGKSDDLRSALYANLAKRLNEKSPMVDMSRDVAETNRNNSLMALLGKASASMGTLGGKTADSSGLADMAKSENAANGQELQGYAADDQRKQQLQQYLMGKLTQQDIASQRAALGQAKLDETKSYHGAMVAKQPPSAGSFSPAGQDADGNILVMDHRTGKIVSSGMQGSRLAGAPKPGAEAGPDGKVPPDPKLVANERSKLTDIVLKGGQRSTIGRLQNKINGAEALETLIAAHPDGNIPPQFMTEMAMGLGNLVSPGQVTQAQIEHLDPESLNRKIAEWGQQLTGKPVGSNMPEFVNLMKETIAREKGAARDQLGRAMAQARYAAPNFFEADPKGFYGLLGMKPEEFSSEGGNFAYIPKVLGKTVPHSPEGGSGTAIAAPGGAGVQAAPDKGLHVPYAPDTMQMGGFTYKKVDGGWKKVSP